MTTAKQPVNQAFIKVINQKISDYLVASGFSYIKEGDVFAFRASPEIIAVLQRQFSGERFVIENKLRF